MVVLIKSCYSMFLLYLTFLILFSTWCWKMYEHSEAHVLSLRLKLPRSSLLPSEPTVATRAGR